MLQWLIKWKNNFFNREYAIIKDSDLQPHTTIRIKNRNNSFRYEKKTYNVIRDKRVFTESKTTNILQVKKKFYYYIENNSNPLQLTENNLTPVIDPTVYDSLLESNIIIKLNTYSNNWLANIEPKHMIVIGIVILILLYIMTGGK